MEPTEKGVGTGGKGAAKVVAVNSLQKPCHLTNGGLAKAVKQFERGVFEKL